MLLDQVCLTLLVYMDRYCLGLLLLSSVIEDSSGPLLKSLEVDSPKSDNA